ncbi:MAG: pyrroline-5-carboxylate reductase [Dehalococcoidales bacterium]
MKIALIGCGNMGQAILSAIVSKRITLPEKIYVSEINKEYRESVSKKFGVYTTDNNLDVIEKGEVVILAVKPQNLAETASQISGKLCDGQLVISIIAGKCLKTLQNSLKHKAVVRAMPNTPAQLGYGMTVWTALEDVTDKQSALAKNILSALGKELYVADEDSIDIATAISGSGPAYVFLFMESLIDAAERIGFSREQAHQIVMQLMIGSVKYADNSDKPLDKLREAVTSPGGTTAAALTVFANGNFKGLVEEAVVAAYKRAKELGG